MESKVRTDAPSTGSMKNDAVTAAVSESFPDVRQAELDCALAAISQGHGTVVWTGEYGMGRSTLLDAIVARVRGDGERADVPVVARLTSERRSVPRGGSGPSGRNLLTILVEDLARNLRGDAQAVSLMRTRGQELASSEQASVEARSVNLLRDLVGDRTLVIAVDDVDESAPGALADLLGLLNSDGLRVVVLATALQSPFRERLPHDVDVRELQPLDTGSALQVLAGAGCLPVAPHVARRLVDRLGGNPACLVQTARLLTGEQLAGTSLLPDPLPVVPAVRTAVATSVSALTARERALLLAAAVTVVDRLDILTAATGVSIVALSQGNLAQQLSPISGRFAFADPRVRALIHGDASIAERTTAHVSLASAHRDIGDPQITAWHTALATLEGDPTVVPALLNLATRHLQRGDTEWAHAVAREAVGHASGDERLAACQLSGIAAVLSGHVHDAAHWLPHAARGANLAARARTLLGLTVTLTLTEERVPDDLLERTRAEASHLDPLDEADLRVLTDVARGLSVAACLHFERGNFENAQQRLDEASALLGVNQLRGHEGTNFARGWLAMYAGEFSSHVDLPAQSRLVDDEALGAVARAVTLMHRDQSASAARVLASAVAELAPIRHGSRWFGGPQSAASPLVEAHLRVVQAMVEMRAGNIARASATVSDAAESLPVGMVLAGLGVTLSRRLDTIRFGRVGATSIALTSTSLCGSGASLRLGMLVDRALAASYREEHVQAATLLELAAERETRERAVVMSVPGLDAVETWAMAGRPEQAREALDRLRSSLKAASPTIREAALARAELALATPSEVVQAAAAATIAARNLESAYERGKVELSIGRAMARLGVREAALAHLMAAQDLFEESGAHAWVTVVGREGERAGRSVALRGTAPQGTYPVPDGKQLSSLEALPAGKPIDVAGHEATRRDGDWSALLTEREFEVAELVAKGLANREVAQRLFCSVRTVEVHLGRIYRKLNLKSRFELVVLVHSSTAGN